MLGDGVQIIVQTSSAAEWNLEVLLATRGPSRTVKGTSWLGWFGLFSGGLKKESICREDNHESSAVLVIYSLEIEKSV